MKILVAGPQGSGKSTQAKILADKFGLSFISIGDLVRKASLENNEEGRLLKKALSGGLLVDDKIAAKLVQKEIAQKGAHGFVLDGYPRHLDQMKFFNPEFDKVIYLDINDGEVERRLLKRGREDDKPEIIKQRLSIYHQLTEPVLEYYGNQGKLIKIDGSKSIKEVSQEIMKKLNFPISPEKF